MGSLLVFPSRDRVGKGAQGSHADLNIDLTAGKNAASQHDECEQLQPLAYILRRFAG